MSLQFSSQNASRLLLSDLEKILLKNLLEMSRFSAEEKFLESLISHFEVLQQNTELQQIASCSLLFNWEYRLDFMNYSKRVLSYLGCDGLKTKINSSNLICEISKDYPSFYQFRLLQNRQIPFNGTAVWMVLFFHGWRLWKNDKSSMCENTIAELNTILRDVCIFE